MNRALASFVMISNSIEAGKDSIDAFIPFLMRLFDLKRYAAADVETICGDFAAEYGIIIPRHPMETILNRMRPRYISRQKGRIEINLDEVRKSAQPSDFEEETRRLRWLLDDFVGFCAGFPLPATVTREEAEGLFISFLKEHDLDIICAAFLENETSVVAEETQVTEPDKQYLLNRYINSTLQKGGPYAEYILDSAVGHKYASLILYREFANIRGKGVCSNYYLDIGVLFDLAGINKGFRQRASEDLLALLRSKGASLLLFRHTYEEFQRIIENCLNWIESNSYDITRASRALQHFKDEGYGLADIQFFISQFDDVLSRNGISIAPPLDPNADQAEQVDRAALQETILDVYNSSGRVFDLEDKAETLERDELSIEAIYKLRKGKIPTNLNGTSHVFVTANAGLAYASMRFERDVLKRGYFTIPAALTDTFVGTVIWIGEPSDMVKDFSRSKLIAYTNAMIQPRASVMTRFAQEVERAKANTVHPISAESAYLLLTSSIPRKLIADKTLGDANRITTQTPYEVLRELEDTLAAEERAKTGAALRQAEEERLKKRQAEEELQAQRRRLAQLVGRLASLGKWLVIVALMLLAGIVYAVTEFQQTQTWPLRFAAYACSLVSLGSGVTVVFLANRVESWLRDRLTAILVVSKRPRDPQLS